MGSHDLTTVSIFVAPQFDEAFVTQCYWRIRDEGIPINLIGVTKGSLTGARGLMIEPHKRLHQFNQPANHLVIIPGGEQCVSSLISDARIYQILMDTVKRGGYVATMNETKKTFMDTGLLTNQTEAQFIVQNGKAMPDFVDKLVQIHKQGVVATADA